MVSLRLGRGGFVGYAGIGCIALVVAPVVAMLAMCSESERHAENSRAISKTSPTATLVSEPSLFAGIPFSTNEDVARAAGFAKCWDQFPGRICERLGVRVSDGPPLTAQIVSDGGRTASIRLFDQNFRKAPLERTVDRLVTSGWTREAVDGGETKLSRKGDPIVIRFDPWTTSGSFPTLTVSLN